MAHTDLVTPIPGPDVRAELDRILASKGFATAGRLSKLLRYVVEKTLAGETDQLKEYAVGIEVFERDDKYDPRLDSIVRVEAGRLRTRLDEYYNAEVSSSPVRISLPRGGYAAVFTRGEPPPPAAAAEHGCRGQATSTIAGGDSARGRVAVRDRRNGRLARRLESAAAGRPTSGRRGAGIRSPT